MWVEWNWMIIEPMLYPGTWSLTGLLLGRRQFFPLFYKSTYHWRRLQKLRGLDPKYCFIQNRNVWIFVQVNTNLKEKLFLKVWQSWPTTTGHLYVTQQGCQICHQNWFQIVFVQPKCIENDLKKSQICPISGQSDPILMPNLPSLGYTAIVDQRITSLFRVLFLER